MAFSTIVSQVIFFSFMLVVLVGIFIISKDVLIQDRNSLESKKDSTIQQLNTRVSISNASYSAGTIALSISNEGSTTLKTENLDFYVDNIRIPRNDSNRTIQILEPDIQNPRMWDPDETVQVLIDYTVAQGNHTAKIVTEYGHSDIKIFEAT